MKFIAAFEKADVFSTMYTATRHSSMRSGKREDDGIIGDIVSGTLVGTGKIHFFFAP